MRLGIVGASTAETLEQLIDYTKTHTHPSVVICPAVPRNFHQLVSRYCISRRIWLMTIGIDADEHAPVDRMVEELVRESDKILLVDDGYDGIVRAARERGGSKVL